MSFFNKRPVDKVRLSFIHCSWQFFFEKRGDVPVLRVQIKIQGKVPNYIRQTITIPVEKVSNKEIIFTQNDDDLSLTIYNAKLTTHGTTKVGNKFITRLQMDCSGAKENDRGKVVWRVPALEIKKEIQVGDGF